MLLATDINCFFFFSTYIYGDKNLFINGAVHISYIMGVIMLFIGHRSFVPSLHCP